MNAFTKVVETKPDLTKMEVVVGPTPLSALQVVVVPDPTELVEDASKQAYEPEGSVHFAG